MGHRNHGCVKKKKIWAIKNSSWKKKTRYAEVINIKVRPGSRLVGQLGLGSLQMWA